MKLVMLNEKQSICDALQKEPLSTSMQNCVNFFPLASVLLQLTSAVLFILVSSLLADYKHIHLWCYLWMLSVVEDLNSCNTGKSYRNRCKSAYEILLCLEYHSKGNLSIIDQVAGHVTC